MTGRQSWLMLLLPLGAALCCVRLGAMNLDLAEMVVYGVFTVMLTTGAFVCNPYAPLYFLILWLPLQTWLLSMMAQTGCGSDGLIRFLSSIKEVVALCWTALILVRGPRARLPLTVSDRLAVLLVAISTLYLVIPDAVFGSASTPGLRLFGFRTALVPFWAYFIGRSLRYDRDATKKAVRLLLLACAAVTLFGLVEYVFIPRTSLIAGLIPYSVLKGGDAASLGRVDLSYIAKFGGISFKRMMSTFLSPLGLAYFLILPVSLALAARRLRNAVGGWKAVPLLLLLFVPIFLSATRAVLAAVLLAAVVLLSGRRVHRFAIMLAALLLLFFLTPLNRVVIDTVNLSDPSTRAHLLAYTMGVNEVMLHPLGIGLGQAGPNAMFIKGGGGLYAKENATVGESLYLSMAVERGVPSLLLFLLFAASIVSACRWCQRAATDPFERLLLLAITVATVIFAVASLPTEHWFGFQSAFLYWLFAGMAVQRSAAHREQA